MPGNTPDVVDQVIQPWFAGAQKRQRSLEGDLHDDCVAATLDFANCSTRGGDSMKTAGQAWHPRQWQELDDIGRKHVIVKRLPNRSQAQGDGQGAAMLSPERQGPGQPCFRPDGAARIYKSGSRSDKA